MAAEGTVLLRGKEVAVCEGDVVLLHDHRLLSRLVGAFDGGWSHCATVVAHQGRLVAFSVYRPPDGLTFEPLERFGAACYARMAIVRPRARRTARQTLQLRRAVQEVMRQHADDPRGAYDKGVAEYVHALLGLQPASADRYICSELVALLARAAGAWPAHRSVSVRVDEVARVVGNVEIVY